MELTVIKGRDHYDRVSSYAEGAGNRFILPDWAGTFAAYQESYEFVSTDLGESEHPIVVRHYFVRSDLSDIGPAADLRTGVDAVMHLAGAPNPDVKICRRIAPNILATTYLIEAARQTKVRRFVFASSAQTIEGYPLDRQIVPEMAVTPANLDGVSKCYGALFSFNATTHGMSRVSLRTGAFEPVDGPPTSNHA